MKGIFIVLDGLDGAGLSTQARLLEKWLRKKGKKVLLTKEPTFGMIGGLIKSVLKREWKTDQKALQLLFSADRAHHLQKEIIPALERGYVVICDRYILSTYCFGVIDRVDLNWLRSINSKFLKPEITIILDVPPQVSLERVEKSRFSLELFEEIKKLKKVRRNYHKLKNEFPNTFVVDGTKSIHEVHAEIKNIIEKFISKK
ncbi:MAG: dTMP kinase [Candidatus Aenigmarchaeota archaeon]|nr:dTMP kinase [Candidatus Aenigmarchaeota archaeon]